MIQTRAVPFTAFAFTLVFAACGDPATLLSPDDEPVTDAPTAMIPAVAGTITLITGDRVALPSVSRQQPGTEKQLARISPRVTPGPGRSKIGFTIQQRNDEFTVMPQDMAALVASGQLDPRLFNVTRLIADGFGDDKRADLPLVVTGQRDAAALRTRMASVGLRVERELSTLHAMVVRQDKGPPSPLLASLVAPTGSGRASQAKSRGATRIWLDRPYKPALHASAAQLGPAADRAGLTGAGVTVAVLDSGVDARHAALAGKVAAAESFVEDGSSAGLGHATQIASMIAGSKVRPDGEVGVAPGATLISGRVCSDSCPLSAILAGIEWSVVHQRARVVNLSLAFGDGPGDDLLVEAIDQLSADHGTVFVTAGESPRAAGEAALVLQQHPDWTGAQVRSAVLGAASPSPAPSAPPQSARQLAAFDLTIRVLDTAGNVASALLLVIGADPGTGFVSDFITGPSTFHLPAGRYMVWTFDASGTAVLVAPRFALTRDSELVMDGRLSKPLDVDVVGQDLAQADLSWVLTDITGRTSIGVSAGTQPLQAGQIGADAPPGEISSTVSALLVPADEPTAPSAVYTIARFAQNQFFTGWKQTLRSRDLATVHARHAGAEGTQFTKNAGAIPPDNGSLTFLSTSYVGPFERTEHYYGPGFQWITSLDQGVGLGFAFAGLSQLVEYRAGQTTTESWNRAPLAPAFSGIRQGPFGVLGSPRREGDLVIVEGSLFSDQSRLTRDGFTQILDTAHGRLLRNGEVIEEFEGLVSPFPSFFATPESAEYRIEQEVTRPADLFDLSTEVTAAWTFRTQHAEGAFEILPLPSLRFSLDLDEHNQTRARALVLPVHVERVAGAATPRITTIRVDASFDDGASWARVPLLVFGDDALGIIVHPPGATHVSLRGSTADVRGNAAEMKVIRAYGLAPR